MIEIASTITGVVLKVHAQPRASRDAIAGEHNGALKVAVTAPPVDGKANAAIIKLLAKQFDVPKSAVEITAGHAGRDKRVAIDGVTVDQARMALARL
jgi:uncharacterized protein (TIGR00251 family)